MGPERSARYEFAEIELQNSGFSSGEPKVSIRVVRQEPGRGVEGGDVPRRQRVSRSGYEATTPAHITPALISPAITIERSVMYPPMECPHMPMRFGSASACRFMEATALRTSTV